MNSQRPGLILFGRSSDVHRGQAQLTDRLAGALESGEFQLHCQPVLDMRRGRVAGVEALLRWQHLELGLVLPGEFLPATKTTRLILPIGDRCSGKPVARARAGTRRETRGSASR